VYVAGMVTSINRHRRRLFLKEHRKAHKVSATEMGKRLGIERESVYRQERNPKGVNSEKQAQWATALGIEPEDLWRPPGRPSLDAMTRNSPEAVQDMAADIVRRLVSNQ
jgi:DNA-binding XRE family transcriptional regulator